MRRFGVPAGLLAPGNKVYSDVTLCCGGTLNFSWMVTLTLLPTLAIHCGMLIRCVPAVACCCQETCYAQSTIHNDQSSRPWAEDGCRVCKAFCQCVSPAQQPHGIWQLASRACPAAFVNNPAAGQQQLQAITPNGTQILRFGTPGKVQALLLQLTL